MSAGRGGAPGPLRVWWVAIRPATLLLALTPVLVGIALAWSEHRMLEPLVGLATLLAAVLIQAGTNLHNDAADHARGTDGALRVGPLRVTAAGWVSAGAVRRAAKLAFGAAFLVGCYLAAVGGWPIVAIGLAALLAAPAYSGGRAPVSHTAFGEAMVWLFFGVLAVTGTYWLQTGRLSAACVLAGALLGLPAAAVLLVNNLRDLAADARGGRCTLAAVLGEMNARRLHAALMLTPFLMLPVLAVLLPARPGLWAPLLALPAAIAVVQAMRRASGAGLNPVLAATARAQLLFGVLLAAGVTL